MSNATSMKQKRIKTMKRTKTMKKSKTMKTSKTTKPTKKILNEIKKQAMFGKDPNKFISLIEKNNVDVNTVIGGKTLLRWVLWGAYNYSRYRINYIQMADYLIGNGANYNLVNYGNKTDLEHISTTKQIKEDFLTVINNRISNSISSVMVTKRREMPSMKKWGDKNIMSKIYNFAKTEKKKTRKRKRNKKEGKKKIKKMVKKTATAKKTNRKHKNKSRKI